MPFCFRCIPFFAFALLHSPITLVLYILTRNVCMYNISLCHFTLNVYLLSRFRFASFSDLMFSLYCLYFDCYLTPYPRIFHSYDGDQYIMNGGNWSTLSKSQTFVELDLGHTSHSWNARGLRCTSCKATRSATMTAYCDLRKGRRGILKIL